MWLELVREFLHDLRAQRTRAFLTIVAITWGTVAVVLLLVWEGAVSYSRSDLFPGPWSADRQSHLGTGGRQRPGRLDAQATGCARHDGPFAI